VSDSLLYLPLSGLLIGIALWILISWAGARSVNALENIRLERLQEAKARPILAEMLSHDFVDPKWLDEHYYEPLGVFRQGIIYMAVWQRGHERTYLAIYLAANRRRLADVETMFDDDGGLQTGSTSETHVVPPRPNHWKQSFSVKQLTELHQHHEEGLAFLQDTIGARPGQQEIPVEEEIIEGSRATCHFVRSIPLWPLRMPYWYFVRRHRLHGIGVRQQFESRRPERALASERGQELLRRAKG